MFAEIVWPGSEVAALICKEAVTNFCQGTHTGNNNCWSNIMTRALFPEDLLAFLHLRNEVLQFIIEAPYW